MDTVKIPSSGYKMIFCGILIIKTGKLPVKSSIFEMKWKTSLKGSRRG